MRGIENGYLTDSYLKSINTVRISLSISSGFLHRDQTLLIGIAGSKMEAKLNKSFRYLLSGNLDTTIFYLPSILPFEVKIPAKLGTFKNLLLFFLKFYFLFEDFDLAAE